MMTAPAINLDPPEPDDKPATRPSSVPFMVWMDGWRQDHPAKFGAAITCALAVLAVFGFLAAHGIQSWRDSRDVAIPRKETTHLVQVAAVGETATRVIRRDTASRGENLGDAPFTATDITAISISVQGPGARCQITVDGRVADEAESAGGEQVICLWIAGR